jgi:hypothetical protein
VIAAKRMINDLASNFCRDPSIRHWIKLGATSPGSRAIGVWRSAELCSDGLRRLLDLRIRPFDTGSAWYNYPIP